MSQFPSYFATLSFLILEHPPIPKTDWMGKFFGDSKLLVFYGLGTSRDEGSNDPTHSASDHSDLQNFKLMVL